YAQERYAEQAFEEKNQPLYRECLENLSRLASYLDQLGRDTLPRSQCGPPRPPEQEARDGVDCLEASLPNGLEMARTKGGVITLERLSQIAERVQELRQKVKPNDVADAPAIVREVRRLLIELQKINQELREPGPRPAGADAGLLEGTL